MTRRVARHRRSAALVAALCALVGLSAPPWPDAAFGAEKRARAQGRVLTSTGDPLAGWPVMLISTQRYLELGSRKSGGRVVTVGSAVTDASGYFSFDVPKEKGYQFWFLRFVDPSHLDPVMYLPPEDVEITADIRRGRVASVEKSIAWHPDWAEVQRRIEEQGGEATEKGKILRAIGLPEKTQHDPVSGVEEWWYFTKGILYTFRGSESAGTRRFDPVSPPPGPRSEASPPGTYGARGERVS